jgi:hypothetical protein
MSPTRGLLRGSRAASLGVVGYGLALLAHVAAGGITPGPAALLLLAGLMGLASLLLTGVRLSPVLVGVSLTAMQVVLHEVFMWLGTPADCSISGVSASGAGHLGQMGQMGQGQPMLECTTDMAQSGMGQRSVPVTSAMAGAHVAATAVMAALLAYGEKVLWFLAGYVRPPRLRVSLPELPALPAACSGAQLTSCLRFTYGGVGRRGPPPRSLFAIV